ncbi:MAG: VWA domain-containing protein [Bacteroidota bacterium]
MKRLVGIYLACTLNIWVTASAQIEETGGIYLILDASGSMWGKLADESTKIQTAKNVLSQFFQQDFAGREIALRVYGHRREKDCSDSELLIPFSKAETVAQGISTVLEGIQPKGRTPISRSFREALKDFGDRKGKIILISDGIETCEEDPCELMRLWKEKEIGIEVHVVGLGLNEREKTAMQCIADAAETAYRDASTTEELQEELQKVKQSPAHTSLVIRGRDSLGREQQIEGFLLQEGVQKYAVSSNGRNPVEAGPYDLQAGIRTANGTLYLPVFQELTIQAHQENIVMIDVALPPQIYFTFEENGKPVKGSLIRAYQADKKVFTQRDFDTLFVNPGTYEFRAAPNSDNKLAIEKRVEAQGKTHITFQLLSTTKVYLQAKAKNSAHFYPLNCELWQNGQKRYTVHRSNGKKILPGTYDVIVPLPLGSYTFKKVSFPDQDSQELTLEVPCGFVSFSYQKADGSEDTHDRVFISSGGKNQRIYHYSGDVKPLLPGEYRVEGWRHKGAGKYPETYFEVEVGKTKKVIIRAEE